MPFPDELFAHRAELVPYQERWAGAGAVLVETLHGLMPSAAALDHIGSTAVPGLSAKDCLDAIARVIGLAGADLTPSTRRWVP